MKICHFSIFLVLFYCYSQSNQRLSSQVHKIVPSVFYCFFKKLNKSYKSSNDSSNVGKLILSFVCCKSDLANYTHYCSGFLPFLSRAPFLYLMAPQYFSSDNISVCYVSKKNKTFQFLNDSTFANLQYSKIPFYFNILLFDLS